jgi:hypothetical protein
LLMTFGTPFVYIYISCALSTSASLKTKKKKLRFGDRMYTRPQGRNNIETYSVGSEE